MKFILSGLGSIYRDAFDHKEPTFAFEVAQGRGRFVFLMFFDSEDDESGDRLFIFLRHTRVILKFKLYGCHRRGESQIYIEPHHEAALVAELQLGHGEIGFDLERFMAQLNSAIPAKLSLQATLDNLRQVLPDVRKDIASVVDEADKTILIGIRRLPPGSHPRERTLRKLYIHTNGSATAIRELVSTLKAARITLAWTNDPAAVAKNFADILQMARLPRDERLPRRAEGE